MRHPVEVIDYELGRGSRGGGTFGGRAMAGTFDPSILPKPRQDGHHIADIVRAAGIDPAQVVEAARQPGELAAYLELHPEQGGRLEGEAEFQSAWSTASSQSALRRHVPRLCQPRWDDADGAAA